MATANEKNYVCACANMRRASRAVSGLYDRFMADCGINGAQYSLLTNIGRLAPVNVSALAAAVRLDRTTLVRNLAHLERKGLVGDASRAGERDRQLILTPKGEALTQRAKVLWKDAQNALARHMGQGDMEQLIRLLKKAQEVE